jgi:two-component system LytT family sensor kinase
MKPPADRRLDLNGTGVDLPAPPRPRYGLSSRVPLATATALSVLTTLLAAQLAMSSANPPAWRSIVIFNSSYWFLWALLTPAVVWLAQHFRFERPVLARALLVHLPGAALLSVGHVAVITAVQWWLALSAGGTFDWGPGFTQAALTYLPWELVTYAAIAALGHAVLYYRETRDRAARATQIEAQLIEARMATLQQQLQPHFLFNALHAISSLMHGDIAAADRTLMRLGDLLRMTLEHAGRPEVTLQTELDFLSKYLEIEQTRFGDRLIVRFDIDPETLDALLPSLLLQPLVENAIKHGVSRKSGPGHVDITTRREHDKLWIEIRDDGAGLSESALSALQKGVGVSTTRARLQHRFGADFRFEFHRQEPGVAVVVAVPWRSLRRSAPEHQQAMGEPVTGRIHGARREQSELTPGQPALTLNLSHGTRR